jgi:MerR family transcriptional regulator, repressor of the yfmOP operon
MTRVAEMGGPVAARESTARPESGSDESRRTMRIGEVAELTGTTPRTIRYYEELGLLGEEQAREHGQHRCYDADDVERITEVVRLKELLGLSLDQLRTLIEREAARAEMRSEFRRTEDPARRRELLVQLLDINRAKLELVRGRLQQLTDLESEIAERLVRVGAWIDDLD